MKKPLILFIALLGIVLFFVCKTPSPQKTCKAVQTISHTCGEQFTDDDQEQCIAQFTELKKERKALYKMVSKVLIQCSKEDTCQDIEQCISDNIGRNLSHDKDFQAIVKEALLETKASLHK